MFTRLIKMEDKVRTKFDVNIQNSTVRTAVSPKDICTAYLEGYFYAKHASR